MTRLSRRIAQYAMLFASLVAVARASGADDPPSPTGDRGAGRMFVQACRADAERLCADVDRGGGKKIACLRDHAAQLTPPCREGLERMTANRKDIAPK